MFLLTFSAKITPDKNEKRNILPIKYMFSMAKLYSRAATNIPINTGDKKIATQAINSVIILKTFVIFYLF